MVEAARGALRRGVEAPDALDLVPEKLDADRAVRRRRIDIDDTAAPRNLTRLLNERLACIAPANPFRQPRALIEAVADTQVRRVRAQLRDRHHGPHQAADGGHDYRAHIVRLRHREPVEDIEARCRRCRIARQHFVRQCIGRLPVEKGDGSRRHVCADRIDDLLRAIRPGGDEKDGPPEIRRDCRLDIGARRDGEAGKGKRPALAFGVPQQVHEPPLVTEERQEIWQTHAGGPLLRRPHEAAESSSTGKTTNTEPPMSVCTPTG